MTEFLSNQIKSAPSPDRLRTEEWLDLKVQSFVGGVFTLGAQSVKLLLQFVSVIILARLLTPEDYGLFAIVIAISVFVNLLKDMGLPTITIQNPEITNIQVSNLFWINTTMGFGFAFLMVVAAPFVGWIYHEPRLIPMLVVMAITCLAGGMSSQHQALLKRSMRFKTLAVLDVVSMMAGVSVAILAAVNNRAYWSLVYMHLAMEFTGAVGTWWACPWRPESPRRHSGIRLMLKSGQYLTLTTFLSYIGRNLDALLIGWSRGPGELGFYNKSYTILLLPSLHINLPVSGVALSSLSRTQGELEQHRRHYTRIVLLTTSLGMPLVSFLFVVAEKAILVILGQQWLPCVPIFRALSPTAFLDCLLITLTWALISIGKTDRLFRMIFTTTVVTVAGFIVGLSWGAFGVAVALSFTRVGSLIPMVYYVCRHSHLSMLDVLGAPLRPFLASVAAACGLWGFASFVPTGESAMSGLMVDALIFGCLYAGLWVSIPGGIGMLKDIVKLTPLLWRGSDSKH